MCIHLNLMIFTKIIRGFIRGLRQLIFIWPCALAIIAALTMGFFYTLNEKRFALIIEEINQRKNKEMATEEKTASVTL